jgi:FAD/FMN-containing dehydrogenase
MSYQANYTSPDGAYTGRAVAYAAGTQAFEGSVLMRQYNMTMLIAGRGTVGIAGGFLQGGGHSGFTSYYGLAADQVLALSAVTADGRVVEMHEGLNKDLFWAFRGGGGGTSMCLFLFLLQLPIYYSLGCMYISDVKHAGTFGVLTSVVVKAFPQTHVVSGSIRFSTKASPGSNSTIDTETFWAGVKTYWVHATSICDAGGLGYSFIYPAASPTGLTFSVSISLPNTSLAQYRSFVRPLLSDLAALGIPVPMIPRLKRSYAHNLNPYPPDSSSQHHPYLSKRLLGETTGHTLLSSRLFPRSSFSTPSSLHKTHTAIRHAVEAGNYTVHGMNYAPKPARVDSAVNPAFRTTVLHAQMYEVGAHWNGLAPILNHTELTRRHERLQAYMQVWRNVAGKEGGSYVNEGDAQDWGWREGFWGEKYEKLLGVKDRWDPEGVFWAIGAVGSERWEVRDAEGGKRKGMVGQDGRVCWVGA